jgi:hypothetical protein
MSYPVFKDFDKSPTDLINDDFDSKYTLKIKSAGPANTTVTTNTAFNCKDNTLVPKLSAKWAHGSGFTLEKFEVSPDCQMTVETSLVGVAPGLKIEFKGNDKDKADLSLSYKKPSATLTADLDIHSFSSAKASVSSGYGAFTGGANVDLKIAKSSIDSTTCGLGVGYTQSGNFVGVRANKNLSSYTGLFEYTALPKIGVAGKVDYTGKETSAAMAMSYQCNPDTIIKLKATSGGVLSTSVKQSFDKKFSVVGSAEVPSDFNTVKFGVNATLG